MFLKTNKIFFLFLLSFFALFSEAAKISQVKNSKVMIDLEEDEARVNQEFNILNSKNKKIGYGRILQVKNGKAVGLLSSGNPTGNEKIKLLTKKKKSDYDDEDNSYRDPVLFRANSKRLSGVIGTLNNSMTTKQSDGVNPTPNVENVSMSGSSIGFTAVIDWPMNHWFTFRGTAGYEPFKASGAAQRNVCQNLTTTNCTAEINYLSAGGYARAEFFKLNGLFWGAVGGTFKVPMSKSATALKEDDIKFTTTYGFATGYDFFINTKNFIPFSLEQQYFLKSDTVDASIFMIRIGFGVNY